MNRRNTYEKIDQFPEKALSIKEFAAQYNNGKGCRMEYVYQMNREGKVKIFDFHGYNFVLPKENK